jgi:hypothetical protein
MEDKMMANKSFKNVSSVEIFANDNKQNKIAFTKKITNKLHSVNVFYHSDHTQSFVFPSPVSLKPLPDALHGVKPVLSH